MDGTLAPIVRHADDAIVPAPTRSLLSAIAKRYGLVACVSGRRATDTRRIVSIGSIAYIGNHGGEVLRPAGPRSAVDPELAAWTRRIQDFARAADTPELRRLRVRLEDKGAIVGFHWRGAPDETEAEIAVRGIATEAETEGFQTHWGRKVLEVRPPVRIDKGIGVRNLLADADVGARDVRRRRHDRPRRLPRAGGPRGRGPAADRRARRRALRRGAGRDRREADLLVDGPAGVHRLLESLLCLAVACASSTSSRPPS